MVTLTLHLQDGSQEPTPHTQKPKPTGEVSVGKALPVWARWPELGLESLRWKESIGHKAVLWCDSYPEVKISGDLECQADLVRQMTGVLRLWRGKEGVYSKIFQKPLLCSIIMTSKAASEKLGPQVVQVLCGRFSLWQLPLPPIKGGYPDKEIDYSLDCLFLLVPISQSDCDV